MAQALSQLHQDIVQIASFRPLQSLIASSEDRLDQLGVLCEDRLVELLLKNRHGDRNNDLSHRWEKGQHLSFGPAEEEWSDRIMQSSNR